MHLQSHRLYQNSAPSGDKTLTPDDAIDVLAELLDAQLHSYILGLKLNLPLSTVDSIHVKYTEPKDRLLHVLIEFTKQVENATWRAIVDALRNPVLNLVPLAKRVEAAHFPYIDPTSTRDVVPEIAPTG